MAMTVEVEREVDVAVLRKCDDGVFEVRIKQGARIGEAEIGQVLVVQSELTTELASVLVDARGCLEMSRRAQELTANNPVNDLTAATAILIDNPVSTFLGNFFIRFAKPPYPTRLFRKEEKARAWLHEILEARRNG